jgi:hypothetical protein
MYPLVMTNIAIENGPFIVDLPIENADFPYSYVSLPEGI